MLVVDQEPQFWFLFAEEGNYVFNVSCEYSFIGYDFTMLLSEDEVQRWRKDGRSYLSSLAEAINYSCPIAKQSKSKYKDRNVNNRYQAAMLDALGLGRNSSGRSEL